MVESLVRQAVYLPLPVVPSTTITLATAAMVVAAATAATVPIEAQTGRTRLGEVFFQTGNGGDGGFLGFPGCGGEGGGIYAETGSTITLKACTLSSNQTGEGGFSKNMSDGGEPGALGRPGFDNGGFVSR